MLVKRTKNIIVLIIVHVILCPFVAVLQVGANSYVVLLTTYPHLSKFFPPLLVDFTVVLVGRQMKKPQYNE